MIRTEERKNLYIYMGTHTGAGSMPDSDVISGKIHHQSWQISAAIECKVGNDNVSSCTFIVTNGGKYSKSVYRYTRQHFSGCA